MPIHGKKPARIRRAAETSPETLASLVAGRAPFLFLDYDGTLVEIRPRPELAGPDQGLLELLAGLTARTGAKVAVVSGRALAQLLAWLPLPGLYLVGEHGLAWQRPDGSQGGLAGSEAMRQALREYTRSWQDLLKGQHGFELEDKEGGLAVHFRQAGWREAARVLARFRRDLPRLRSQGLELVRGKKVWELRQQGINKGVAVRRLFQEAPFAFPVYLGDDTTDEDAFRALAGDGLTVLVGGRRRWTAAEYRLAGPTAVREFLGLLLSKV